jgi:hypothetical protein
VPECSTSQPSPVASSSRGSSRSIAFYDEILTLTLHLELPPTAALPPPEKGWASYPLPVQIDEHESDDWHERTEQARATRLALLVLLNNLHIELRGAYTTPRPALPPGSSPIPPTSAATSSHTSTAPANQRPTPSTERRDAAYSEPSLPGDEVPFYNVAWLGNKVPPEPVNKEQTAVDRVAERRKRDKKQQLTVSQRSEEQEEEVAITSSFASWDQREERWRIEWSVKVPIGEKLQRRGQSRCSPALIIVPPSHTSPSLCKAPTSAPSLGPDVLSLSQTVPYLVLPFGSVFIAVGHLLVPSHRRRLLMGRPRSSHHPLLGTGVPRRIALAASGQSSFGSCQATTEQAT